MNTFTIQDIREMEPCYDPTKYLQEDWQGTAIDILRVTDCPPQDRLWVVCHSGWINNDVLRDFARWCALSVAYLWDMPETVRKYLETGDESIGDAAGDAAGAAAWDAAWAYAWASAWASAEYAARASARDAARASARDAAWDTQINQLISMIDDVLRRNNDQA